MSDSLQQSIAAQRAIVAEEVRKQLAEEERQLPSLLNNREALDTYLQQLFLRLDHCKYVFVLDASGVQISGTINRFGSDLDQIGRDRSQRPYMDHMSDDSIDFNLSEAYISRNKKRPSLTAVQTIRNEEGQRIGFLGVDYDLRELPHTDVIYEEPSQWRQIKGDPAIRQQLFFQERIESVMDRHIDDVLSVHEALIVDQGVHHIQIHFSSSRSTIWHRDDPYVYRLLTMEELSDSNICMAYPQRPYFERAIVPPGDIIKIMKQFKALRFADETIYLRSGSLNTVNGKVGLNFSCDGTHYLSWDEFLSKGLEFWFGGGTFPQAVDPAPEIDYERLDNVIESMAEAGCLDVNKLLNAMANDQVPPQVTEFNEDERDYIYRELKSIMDVYDGGVCGI